MPWTESLAAPGVLRRLRHRLDPGAWSFNLTAPDDDDVANQFWVAACGSVVVWPWAGMPGWALCPDCWDVTAEPSEPDLSVPGDWPSAEPEPVPDAGELPVMPKREPGKALQQLASSSEMDWFG